MEKIISKLSEWMVKINQEAYKVYSTLVEDVCRRTVSEDELSHLLDCLLDFAYDEKMLGVFKKVCRRYLYIYPNCIKFYIRVYREMWEDEEQ